MLSMYHLRVGVIALSVIEPDGESLMALKCYTRHTWVTSTFAGRTRMLMRDKYRPNMVATAVSQSHENVNAETPSADIESSPFRIMDLPKEMRLMIYALVFQDILNEISPLPYPLRPGEYDTRKPGMRDRLRRVLALVHTSHTIHVESRRHGRKLVAARKAYVKDGFDGAFYKRPGEMGGGILMATIVAKRRLRELESMKKLLYNRHW